nr:RHS repeat-associated core domain-containing protein [Ktedonobacteraceae bacterium]
QVINPDNTNDIAFFASSDGWGLAESSFQCYVTGGHCNVAPYWNPNPGMSGRLLMEQNWSAASKLVSVSKNTYAMNCPPPGVSHSNNTNTGLNNPGSTQLSSELDQNNPVVVCDPRVTQADRYQVDGVTDMFGYLTDARVLHQQTTSTYDGDNQGPNHTVGYDYGNVSKVDTTGNVDTSGTHAATSHVVTTLTYYPNDNLGGGIYLTNRPAQQQKQDNTGTVLACGQNIYGANANATTPPIIPGATQSLAYTTSGGCTGTAITVKHAYDISGNPIGNIDGDTHLGCTIGSTQYSACATYDSFGTHLISAANAKNQTGSSSYASSAVGGFGQWLTSMTDANGQITSFQYDVLGRVTAAIQPGDSINSPTIAYTYNNTCTNGATAPCLEIDTTTRTTTGGPTTTTRQWYDGEGHLVETRSPSPFSGSDLITYAIYDAMGRPTTQSLTYSVPSSSGYIAPDLTKARSVTAYDASGRSLGQVTYSDQNNGTFIVLSTSISYTVAQGVTGLSSENSNAYEQTITLDAYNHQSISYSDALGRQRYTQIFSGTNPYSVVRTVGTNYDGLGDTILVQTFDHTATVQATQSATFDALKRRTGMNDSDLGSCQNTPLPAGCSSSTDWAWKLSYDADGNLLSQSDPRNQHVYTSYDALDRPLCRGAASTDVNPCQNSAYASYFYDSYTNSSNPGVTFPTGCIAPSGAYASDPISHPTAETFRSSAGSGWRCGGFDQRGQLDQSTLSVTTASQTTTQTMHMVYNDAGQVTQLVYPDGQTVTSQYDTDGRFRTAYLGTPTSPDPVNFLVGQTNYTGFGALYSLAIGGSGPKASTPTPIFTSVYGYDGIQRPWESSATRQGSSQPFWDQVRSYDNVGNVLGLSTTVPTSSGSTQTEQEAFCYDALNRVTWAGNAGTPAGGDHCMWSAPGSTPLPAYTQHFSYDDLDRLTTGAAGTLSYANASHVHATTNLSTVPNPYATYDAMGNMTCRNVDPSSSHTCGTTPTGAQMTYDSEGRLASWTAPSGTISSITYLYDNEGNRVLQHQSTTAGGTTTTTDTVTFNSYTETVITGGTTLTSQYYTVGGQRVAMKQGNALYYLLGNILGSVSVVLKNDGTFQAAQLFAPYGTTRYTQGTVPTTYNFTGQRLDSQTGLLYYNFRYYDPVVGRFTRADTVQTNGQGMDPYAYVAGDPETKTDPKGQGFAPPPGSGGSTTPLMDADLAALKALMDEGEQSEEKVAIQLGHVVESRRHDNKWFPKIKNRHGDSAGTNGAAGEWYVTLPGGLVIDQHHLTVDGDPVAFSQGKGFGTHSERLLLLSIEASEMQMFETLYAAGSGARLHIVLFTQLEPCPTCESEFAPFFNQLADVLTAFIASREEPLPPPFPDDENTFSMSLSVWSTRYQGNYYDYPGGYKGPLSTPPANNMNIDAVDVFGVFNDWSSTITIWD